MHCKSSISRASSAIFLLQRYAWDHTAWTKSKAQQCAICNLREKPTRSSNAVCFCSGTNGKLATAKAKKLIRSRPWAVFCDSFVSSLISPRCKKLSIMFETQKVAAQCPCWQEGSNPKWAVCSCKSASTLSLAGRGFGQCTSFCRA